MKTIRFCLILAVVALATSSIVLAQSNDDLGERIFLTNEEIVERLDNAIAELERMLAQMSAPEGMEELQREAEAEDEELPNRSDVERSLAFTRNDRDFVLQLEERAARWDVLLAGANEMRMYVPDAEDLLDVLPLRSAENGWYGFLQSRDPDEMSLVASLLTLSSDGNDYTHYYEHGVLIPLGSFCTAYLMIEFYREGELISRIYLKCREQGVIISYPEDFMPAYILQDNVGALRAFVEEAKAEGADHHQRAIQLRNRYLR